ncbi:MAG: hypothetical protein WBK67_02405 [Minisyncoccales bacterium]
MFDKKSNSLGAVALAKARELQDLIDILNSTTVGDLVEQLALKATKQELTDGLALKATKQELTDGLALVHAKINSLAAVFGATFNVDGTINIEEYTTHAHNYEDATIADPVDGSGAMTTETKTTQGVI